MALKILLHHINLFCELRYLFVTSKWFGQWRQTYIFASDLGFQCLSGFFFRRSGVLRFMGMIY